MAAGVATSIASPTVVVGSPPTRCDPPDLSRNHPSAPPPNDGQTADADHDGIDHQPDRRQDGQTEDSLDTAGDALGRFRAVVDGTDVVAVPLGWILPRVHRGARCPTGRRGSREPGSPDGGRCPQRALNRSRRSNATDMPWASSDRPSTVSPGSSVSAWT